MNQTWSETAASEPLLQLYRIARGLRWFFVGLIVFNLGLLVFNLRSLLHGEPDMYPHQHRGLIYGNLTQMFLLSGQICFSSIGLVKPTGTMHRKRIALIVFGFLLLIVGIGFLIPYVLQSRGCSC